MALSFCDGFDDGMSASKQRRIRGKSELLVYLTDRGNTDYDYGNHNKINMGIAKGSNN